MWSNFTDWLFDQEYKLQSFLAHPLTGLLSLLAILAWFIVSFLTNGGSLYQHHAFDPGMSVGGFLTNSLQTVLLFISLTVQYFHHTSVHTKITAIHDKLAEIQVGVEDSTRGRGEQ